MFKKKKEQGCERGERKRKRESEKGETRRGRERQREAEREIYENVLQVYIL